MAWQILLQRWFQQQLRGKVVEHVVQSNRVPSADQTASTRVDVGVVFALSIESGPLEDRLKSGLTTRGRGFVARTGSIADRSVAIVRAGVGGSRAWRAAEALLVGHKPAWVISAGLAGGLRPQLRRGDIVMADKLATTDGRRLALDLKIPQPELEKRPGLHVGGLLAVDRIVVRAADKRELGREHDCLAADMESWSVAEVCRIARRPFMAVRAISDTVDEDLPPEIGGLARPKTAVGKLGAVTGALWRRPGSAKDMWRLHAQAADASERLAKFLVGVIAQLPTSSDTS